jgi:uncharacterized protein (TIGR00661 family)
LDWGLGHATRCVPVIRHLLKTGCKVFIAGSGRSLEFLKTEFPECHFIDLPSYRFIYSKKGMMSLAMFLSSPLIFYGIFREHKLLKKIISQYKIHGVISDNRFGLWNKKVPCIYMTHQVKIRTNPALKFIEPLLYRIHRYFIKKFDMLWIPDCETEPTLSGELAHGFRKETKCTYLGPLSRFTRDVVPDYFSGQANHSDILAIISGPEPQRSIFEAKIREQAGSVQAKIILLQGLPGEKLESWIEDHLTIYPHVETIRLKRMMEQSKIILCRSGYSSIMDLAVLGKKAFFVPTPGQTEQEYLAKYLKDMGICNFAAQDAFKLVDVIESSASLRGFEEFHFTSGVEQAVEKFVDLIYNKE